MSYIFKTLLVIPPQGNAVTSYSGLESLANAQPYSNIASTVPDPAMLARIQNAQQQFNAQSHMALPSGTAAPLSPYQTAQNNLLNNQLNNALTHAPLPNNKLMLSPGLGKALPAPLPLSGTTLFSGGGNPGTTSVYGQSIIPSAQQLISVVGINQLLQYLNKINPMQFNTQTLLSAPRSLVMKAISNLPYDTLLNIFLQLPIQQRAALIMLEGLATTPGEAMLMAQGMYGLIPPTLAEAEANGAIKKHPAPAKMRVAV